MSAINALLDQANAAAAEGMDMSVAVKGGSGGRLLPVGTAFCRLIEVVEMGKHPQEFQGTKKDPALEVQLGFALWGDARDLTGAVVGSYHEEDGSPAILRPYPFAMSANEKARAFLLFKSLNWKGNATSFAQLLSQTFLVNVVHEAKSKTDPKIVSRIDMKSFRPAIDIQTGQPYPVPDVDISKYRLFLWNRPTVEGWDALKVDGTYDDGKSKNFVQERILGALDFAGSPLEQLVFGSSIPSLPSAAAPTQPVSAPSPNFQGQAAQVAPSAPVNVGTAPTPTVYVAHAAPSVTDTSGGVGSAPLSPLAAAPVAAAVPLSPLPPVTAVSPVIPSVIPAG